MECRKVLSMLDDYIDNELNESDINNITLHLNKCNSCKTKYELLNSMILKSRELDDVDIPFDLHENIMKAVTKKRDIKFKIKIPAYLKDWRVYTTITACLLMFVVFKTGIDKKNMDFSNITRDYPPIVSPSDTIKSLKENPENTFGEKQNTSENVENTASPEEKPTQTKEPKKSFLETLFPKKTTEPAPNNTYSDNVDLSEKRAESSAPTETENPTVSSKRAPEATLKSAEMQDTDETFGIAGSAAASFAAPKDTAPAVTDSPKKAQALAYNVSERSSLVKMMTTFVIINDEQIDLAKEVYAAAGSGTLSGMRQALSAKGILYREREQVIEDRTKEYNSLVQSVNSIKAKLRAATSESDIDKYINELTEVKGKINTLIEYCNTRKLAISL